MQYSKGLLNVANYFSYSRSAADPEGQRPLPSKEEIIRAGKQANAHDFIMSFPEGYDTIVGERGIRYIYKSSPCWMVLNVLFHSIDSVVDRNKGLPSQELFLLIHEFYYLTKV